ncbi:hypothetical protein BDB01DRAFT_789592 [Pilobolus umbonatus]|nr:hypothetical protein BDB01DRAFT_789592 [Pilobolus umbonatus]
MHLFHKKVLLDEDELVDYNSSLGSYPRRKGYLVQQIEKCKQKIKREEYIIPEYIIDYTEKGLIKQPIDRDTHTYAPVTMELIRSIILRQHCRIMKDEEIAWFEDGLRWISQQQYQNSSKHISQPHEKNGRLRELEDLERSCEAYFGIPLGLCEHHWAANYLINQASKGKLFSRGFFQPKFSLKRTVRKLCCF